MDINIFQQFSAYFNQSNIFLDALRNLLWILIKFLSWLAQMIESSFTELFKWLNFTTSPLVTGILDSNAKRLIFTLATLSLVILGLRLIVNHKRVHLSELPQNILIFIFTVVCLPTILSMANGIFSNMTGFIGNNNQTATESIIANNITDLKYVDQVLNYNTGYVDSNGNMTVTSNYIAGKTNAKNIIKALNPIEKIKFDDSELTRELYSKKLTYDNNGNLVETDIGSTKVEIFGATLFDFTNYYYRYTFNYFGILLSLIGITIAFAFASLKVVRIAFEIAGQRILAPIFGGADLTSQQKTKQILTGIMNSYIVLLYICLSLKLLYFAIDFATQNFKNPILCALSIFAVCYATIDGPHAIERLFGIDAGLGKGALFSMMALGKGTIGAIKGGQDVANKLKTGASKINPFFSGMYDELNPNDTEENTDDGSNSSSDNSPDTSNEDPLTGMSNDEQDTSNINDDKDSPFADTPTDEPINDNTDSNQDSPFVEPNDDINDEQKLSNNDDNKNNEPSFDNNNDSDNLKSNSSNQDSGSSKDNSKFDSNLSNEDNGDQRNPDTDKENANKNLQTDHSQEGQPMNFDKANASTRLNSSNPSVSSQTSGKANEQANQDSNSNLNDNSNNDNDAMRFDKANTSGDNKANSSAQLNTSNPSVSSQALDKSNEQTDQASNPNLNSNNNNDSDAMRFDKANASGDNKANSSAQLNTSNPSVSSQASSKVNEQTDQASNSNLNSNANSDSDAMHFDKANASGNNKANSSAQLNSSNPLISTQASSKANEQIDQASNSNLNDKSNNDSDTMHFSKANALDDNKINSSVQLNASNPSASTQALDKANEQIDQASNPNLNSNSNSDSDSMNFGKTSASGENKANASTQSNSTNPTVSSQTGNGANEQAIQDSVISNNSSNGQSNSGTNQNVSLNDNPTHSQNKINAEGSSGDSTSSTSRTQKATQTSSSQTTNHQVQQEEDPDIIRERQLNYQLLQEKRKLLNLQNGLDERGKISIDSRRQKKKKIKETNNRITSIQGRIFARKLKNKKGDKK